MMHQLIVLIIILVVMQIFTCTADSSEDDIASKIAQARQEDEEALEKLQENILKTLEKITSFTQESVDIAQEAIDKSAEKTDKELKTLFEEVDEIVSGFSKIKKKAEKDLRECGDRFLGESSVLRHLLDLRREIDYAVKEVKGCPLNIDGMECLINTLIRGESFLNDAEGIIKAERGTPAERVENLLQWIGKCNEKAIETIAKSTQTFLRDISKCT